MNKSRTDTVAMRPLSARSLVLSVLLGSHPPTATPRALAAVGRLFGMSDNTVRTALSRMVAAGELSATDGRYQLTGRLLERQAAQDRQPVPAWDGDWWVAIVHGGSRTMTQRRAFRSRMADVRMGELRPDVWLRPANLPGPASDDTILVTRGQIDGTVDPTELWPLVELARAGRRLLDRMDRQRRALDTSDDPELLPEAFMVSAEAVRWMRSDPLLPANLAPEGWPGDELRATYVPLNAGFREHLGAFLRAIGDSTSSPKLTG